MNQPIAESGEAIQTTTRRRRPEHKITRRVLQALIAGLLAIVVASAALNWDTATVPVVQQNG